ncbi:MAG TPA: YfhO family protein, partial [Kutzneria sp.]|nr:YfhO family protein [Kutzneria sp.]
LGGLAYAGSGFMVMWVDFPQTRTGAFVPALFWTVERFLQSRRVRDAALIAVPVAAMLLGGFPSVTGYAVLTAGCYAVTRLIALHRREPRRMIWGAGGCLGGLVGGVGLVAFELLPFQSFMKTWLIIDRSQTSVDHLQPTTLLTMIAPWAFGTGDPNHDAWFAASNEVETIAYLGAAALVLAVVAIALPWRAKALLPRSVWTFTAAGTAAWLVLNYVGSVPLAVLQDTPVLRVLFGQNYIGRSRSILAFLLAVLVATGYDVLVRRRETDAAAATAHRRRWIWPAAVVAAVLAVFAAAFAHAVHLVHGTAAKQLGPGVAMSLFKHQIAYAAGFTLAAAACVAVLWLAHSRRRPALDQARVWDTARFAAAAALPLLLAWQSSAFASEFFPRSPSNTFYPVTDTQSFLAANLGEQRYASTSTGMVFGTNSAYQLRAVNGHNFINQNFATMIDGIHDGQIIHSTYIDFLQFSATATSPILDQLGTKYWVTALSDPVLGRYAFAKTDGSTVQLQPGRSVTVDLPITGPLRAVGVTPVGDITKSTSDSLSVVVHNLSGATVASTDRLANTLAVKMASGSLFDVPVAADTQPGGTGLTATLTWHGSAPLTVQADAGAPAITAVGGWNDGLRLVHVGSSAIYQRLHAQPRIRWASQSTVVTDQKQRMALLESGKVGANQVVLSADGPAAGGGSASVGIDTDGNDEVSATVDAKSAGYLVVADADQAGWSASVDGHSAPLRAADQGVVAVQVPAGRHVVKLSFDPPRFTLGLALSALSAAGLIAAVVGEWWWPRRRRRTAAPEA